MVKTKKRIISVTVRREVDDDADLSHLGEYSMHPKSDIAIDRKERGHMKSGEYRYFNPAMTGEETGNPESPEQDYKRAEDYNNGNWCMLSVRAEAEVQLTGDTVQRICSGGLWGIESDSEESYFEEIERGELSNLKDELLAMGFGSSQISKAFAKKSRKGW